MGMRIHTAIGWAMSPELFLANTGLTGDDPTDIGDLLEQLDEITKLKVPPTVRSQSFRDPGSAILHADLLQGGGIKNFPKWQKHRQVDNAGALIKLVGFDDYDLVMFFPDGYYATKWNRWDDDIDYAFGYLNEDGTFGDPLETRIPMQSNPYPFEDNWLDQDGRRVRRPEGFRSTFPHLEPCAPPSLEWWVTETKTLKPDAWKLLRPYACRWWA